MPDRVKLCPAGERAIALDPTNHHNAVHCPHCNPGNEYVWIKRAALARPDTGLAGELEALLEKVQDSNRPLPWVVHSGSSYRRIASDPTRENPRSFPDGNVLHGIVDRHDGHHDLSMGEDQLNALVGIINRMPAILAALRQPASDPGDVERGNALETLTIGMESARDIALSARLPKERWSCSDDASGTALTLSRQRQFIAEEINAAIAALQVRG
jgi:hypothetical protein